MRSSVNILPLVFQGIPGTLYVHERNRVNRSQASTGVDVRRQIVENDTGLLVGKEPNVVDPSSDQLWSGAMISRWN